MASRKSSDRLLSPALRLQPDRRLVTLAREGSEPAVEEIVRRYRPALVRYAASVVPADRADDVVQDSLARALPGIGFGEGDLRLRPWLFTIVRNTAFNALRDAGPPHEQLDENYDGVEQPPQAMERHEQVRSLVAGLQALPEPQREALVKREMEGRSHAEIGAEMGVSTGAARQLIFRARNALRDGIGSLVPMPLLRHLAESGDGGGGAVATATGGGAIVAKVAIAIVATGAVVTAGVAIHHAGRHPTGAANTPVSGQARKDAVPLLTGTAGESAGVAREIADRHGHHGANHPESSHRHGSRGNRHGLGVVDSNPSEPSGHSGHGGPSSDDGANQGSGPSVRGGEGSENESESGHGGHVGGASDGGGGPGPSPGSSSSGSDSESGGGGDDGVSGDASGESPSSESESDSGGSRDLGGGGGFSEATDQQSKEDG